MSYSSYAGEGERAFYRAAPVKTCWVGKDQALAVVEQWRKDGWTCTNAQHLDEDMVRLSFRRAEGKER